MDTLVPNWEANQFTVIAFPTNSLVGHEQELWQELFGEPYEKLNQTKTNGSVGGEYKNCHFLIETDHLRVKITQLAVLDVNELESPFPTVGTIENDRDLFDIVAKKWLSSCPPISRLAFASNLASMTKDKNESYRLLSQILNYPRLENASDFNLQINRPRTSAVIDGEINRLIRWRALTVGIKGHVSDRPDSGKDVHIIDDQSLVAMALDINTAPLGGNEETLPQEKLMPLYDELVSFALEIAAKGDID